MPSRPPGVKLDSGARPGYVRGRPRRAPAGHEASAVNCAADLLIGGAGGLVRPIEVQSPFDGSILHAFNERGAAWATSGPVGAAGLERTGSGPPSHLDPSTGHAAFTGARAGDGTRTDGLLAEARAKAGRPRRPAGRPALAAPRPGWIGADDGSHQADRAPTGARARAVTIAAPRASGADLAAGLKVISRSDASTRPACQPVLGQCRGILRGLDRLRGPLVLLGVT